MQRITGIISLIIMLFLVVNLSSCQGGNEPLPADQATQPVPSDEGGLIDVPPSTDLPPDQIQLLWENSPHAQTYVTDEMGTNSTCAYCHAPVNYIPSMEDMPESCSACKFEIDPPAPTIAETGWDHIPCNVCHRVKKGEVVPDIAWLLIPPIDEYENVASSTDLCLKCHLQVDIPDHQTPDVSNAHADFTCTQCHDPHSTIASCSSLLCHPDSMSSTTSIPGHDENHQAVTCWACHDAAGLEVGPDELDNWVTFVPGGTEPYASHNILTQASCERCHYTNNPWDLSIDVSDSVP